MLKLPELPIVAPTKPLQLHEIVAIHIINEKRSIRRLLESRETLLAIMRTVKSERMNPTTYRVLDVPDLMYTPHFIQTTTLYSRGYKRFE